MPPKKVNPGSRSSGEPTRRDVLRAAAAAGFCALTGTGTAHGQQATSQPATSPANAQPWWVQPPYTRSRVVDIRSDQVFDESSLDQCAIERILARGVCALTGKPTPAESWRAILGSARSIVLKFNSVGAEVIGTTGATAAAIIKALVAAGYDRRGIVAVELSKRLATKLEVAEPNPGWGSPIPVGGRQEPLANYVREADAMIDVPFLKTHHIAGMSGCMKNISHAVIRHPGRYHDNRCSPYIGQVIGSTEVSSKLRLSVVDALRMVIRNGPDAAPDDLLAHGGLLLGFDPVAVDTVGLSLLTLRRRQVGIRDALDAPCLRSAAALGVGRVEGHDLEQVVIAGGA